MLINMRLMLAKCNGNGKESVLTCFNKREILCSEKGNW